MKIIDPHIHLFNLDKGDYHWLSPDNPPFWPDKEMIRRNFLESDLLAPGPFELAGFVHIEAGYDNAQPARELVWLEQHCKRPFRSVSYAPINDKHFAKQLALLLKHKSLVGIRHILEADATAILSHKHSSKNLALLSEHGLLFEAQFNVADTAACQMLIKTLSSLPELKVVINHAGYYPISQPQQWLANMQALATLPNTAVKFSGWELAERQFSTAWLQQAMQDLLSAFPIERIMLASNFPVCLLADSLQNVWQHYYMTLGFDEAQWRQVSCDNAKLHYHLGQSI